MNTMNTWKKGEVKPANWPQWLKEVDIEWCRVAIIDSIITWHDGGRAKC